jgi:tRNA 2-thiocytidine biosynthesis protein TtcA
MDHSKQTSPERFILRKVGRAIGDFGLIDSGDRILVAHSGGKDSWILLHSLAQLQKKAPVRFELVALTIDAGFPAFHPSLIAAYCSTHLPGIAVHVHAAPIYRIAMTYKTEGTGFCSFCARLRRGVLYTRAQHLGCNKIALAHHADDFIETLLLNQFFNGSIKAMSPLLQADDGKNIVIRPLCYVPERAIETLAVQRGFPILTTDCPAAGRQDMKRKMVKNLLAELERSSPGVKASLLSALGRVEHRHLMHKLRDAGKS